MTYNVFGGTLSLTQSINQLIAVVRAALPLRASLVRERKLNKKLSHRRDSAGRRSLRRSRSFEVTVFWHISKARMRLPISDQYQLTSYLAPFARYRAESIMLLLLTEGASL